MAMESILDTLPGPQLNAGSQTGHNYKDILIHGSKVHMGDIQYNFHGE